MSRSIKTRCRNGWMIMCGFLAAYEEINKLKIGHGVAGPVRTPHANCVGQICIATRRNSRKTLSRDQTPESRIERRQATTKALEKHVRSPVLPSNGLSLQHNGNVVPINTNRIEISEKRKEKIMSE